MAANTESETSHYGREQTSPLVEIRNVRKSFGQRVAVDGVDLNIPRGICYGLLGPNGAGKTTTISMIAGTTDADNGSITIDGLPVHSHELESKRLIGYVPQDLALYEELSTQDNLKFFAMLYGMSGIEMNKAIDASLEVGGLTERRKEPVRQFSGGMKRRLNIAIALLHNPVFLILDEPTVGVDPQSRNQIFDTLEAVTSTGKTILYTTHYMEEVERLCSSVAIMDNGKIIASGRISELIERLNAKNKVAIRLTGDLTLSELGLDSSLEPILRGQKLVVTIDDIGTQLPGLLQHLTALTRVESVETERPTLEEVFLQMTGRSLRD